MDYIFDCFFDETFEKIPRNGLQDRSSRRDVLDHLSAIIGGCSDGHNKRADEVAGISVQSAIRWHREKKNANCNVCMMGKFHNILYIALRTCWDWGVRESAVVVELLEAIYECEKTFERIFLGAIFGSNAPHLIAGWRSDFRDQEENTRAVVYLLKHATKESMALPVWIPRHEQENMIKFIDIPIESCGKSSPLRVALQANAPDFLLLLLRYGASPNPPDGGSCVVLSLLDKLKEDAPNYIYQNVFSLHILLRNIPIIEMPYKPFVWSVRREMFFEKYKKLLIDNIIPKEQVYGVMSLRHLSRCRIRDLLRRNGQLPDGIDTLRLPKRLQRYIDLMEEIEGPETNSENNDKQQTSKKCVEGKIEATGDECKGKSFSEKGSLDDDTPSCSGTTTSMHIKDTSLSTKQTCVQKIDELVEEVEESKNKDEQEK